MQMPPQRWRPTAQAHLPPEQLLPPVHLTAQAPQFSLSEVRSTHAPLHSVSPVEQLGVHRPCMQSSRTGQMFPHDPQLARLLFRSMQRLLHTLRPVPQLHFPSMHSMAPGQVVAQVPQLRVSDCRSTQPPAQAERGIVHMLAQLPCEQTWAPLHT
jgi:hypothetical protein